MVCWYSESIIIGFSSLPLETFAICLQAFFRSLLYSSCWMAFVLLCLDFSQIILMYTTMPLHLLLYRNHIVKFNRVHDVYHDAFAFAPTETKQWNYIPGNWLYYWLGTRCCEWGILCSLMGLTNNELLFAESLLHCSVILASSPRNVTFSSVRVSTLDCSSSHSAWNLKNKYWVPDLVGY